MMNRQAEMEQGSTSLKRKRTGIPKLLDDTVASTYDDVIAIVEAKFELLKIELTEKISAVASATILVIILIIGIAYLLTTLALLTGELLGHTFLGYLFVSLLFLSCFLFFTKFKPLLLKNLIQKIFLSVHDYNK
ncbi:MAG: phage holin family protein [Chlorobiaceae bacterium]|jgi:hypothetical protein|nr:phage holin family protein [Chlorobiaceae bacterium]NTV16804.1 phage holin family protein [Chlorobiaceae bacterium]